jgi:putative ABC transport system permease protein
MTSLSLWLKWSLRDMRRRWWQVIVVALIIALGTGVYCGLGSSMPWRTKSFNESYAMLNMYDLKMELTPGSYLVADDLAQVVGAVEHAAWIQDSEMRLSLPTPVDASTSDQTILVPGRIIGVDVASGGPAINGLHIAAGRALEPADSGEPVCIVENNFARYYDLSPGDREIRIREGRALECVGNGMAPEYFMVLTAEGGIMAQANFAALFVPLATVQEVAGLPGMVNDLLITISGDADVEILRQELKGAMEKAFPQVGVTFETKSENATYALMKEDIPGDQEMYNIFAYMLLAGAAFGTFNLVSRMVESQRREIGINMALGVAPRVIARRHLFVGAQIALLGMIFGLGIGVVLSNVYSDLLREMLPMPYFETPFQFSIFLRGALLGFAIPLIATVYPVWRAVRVAPIDAIQTGHLVAKGGGLAPFLARLPFGALPGSSLVKFPFRNLSRNPRRTLLTALGITMAVTLLVATGGMMDTFFGTLHAAREEHLQDVPDLMLVTLDNSYPVAQLPVSDPGISQAEPIITLPGAVSSQNGGSFDVIIQLLDLDNELWSPTLLRGDKQTQGPGVIIAAKAARDLDVDVGDTITLQHPYRESAYAYGQKESQVRVMGIHADVVRMYLYMDSRDATLMNLDGMANGLQVLPVTGVAEATIRRELAHMPGVASVQPASALLDAFDQLLDMFVRIFRTSQYIAILLAFLIAFNTASINVDERRRELATMFAFGTRIRATLRIAMVENLMTGVLGTIVGAGLGWVVLNRLLMARMDTMEPDFGLLIQVSPLTLILAIIMGVLLVALTPVFTMRRILRMDIPSTLRVIE